MQDPTFYRKETARIKNIETTRRRGLQAVLLLQDTVEKLELKLGITVPWTEDSAEWQAASKSLAEQEYQRAVDRLEGLVVQRLFELSKMNRAGTSK